MAASRWFRQDTSELREEWFFFLSAEERLAWMYLKSWVRDGNLSQKSPGVAPSKSSRVAAHEWNITHQAVESMIQAAVTAGELIVGEETWEVTDKQGFVTEGRPAIPIEIKRAVIERDGFKCLVCGLENNLSFDHILPYSLGGEDSIENLQILCMGCNLKKGTKTQDFRGGE